MTDQRMLVILAGFLLTISACEIMVDFENLKIFKNLLESFGIVTAFLFTPTFIAIYHLVDEFKLIRRIFIEKLIKPITSTVFEQGLLHLYHLR